GRTGCPGRTGCGNPVGAFAPYLALDQAGTLHARQQLGERDARSWVPDCLSQRGAGHPGGVPDLAGRREMGHDAVAGADRPLPATRLHGYRTHVPHVSAPLLAAIMRVNALRTAIMPDRWLTLFIIVCRGGSAG